MRRPKGMIFDLDGTIRWGKEPIPGATQAVRRVADDDISICYLTNNSTKERSEVLSELMEMGFPPSPVITSSLAASMLLSETLGSSRCLVVGEDGLIKELEMAGHEAVRSGEGAAGPFQAVVAGLDRTFDYSRLREALDAIRGGALFIATNEDPTLPVGAGKVLPGAGTVVSAIKTGSGRSPIVAGKPEPYSTLLAIRRMGLGPVDVLMVGDRYDVDALAAKKAGCASALVRTGDPGAQGNDHGTTFDDISSLVDAVLSERDQ